MHCCTDEKCGQKGENISLQEGNKQLEHTKKRRADNTNHGDGHPSAS